MVAKDSTYNFTELMTQTRKLAAEYRRTTGQSLPVTSELARFDACRLLNLIKDEDDDDFVFRAYTKDESSSDVNTASYERLQIKGRVIFPGQKARQFVGQLNFSKQWDWTVLVIYNADYQATSIYQVPRDVLESQVNNESRNKRGALTVVKFKAIGEKLWELHAEHDH